jgi:hypothetical protein
MKHEVPNWLAEVSAALALLVSLGLLTKERKAEILAK